MRLIQIEKEDYIIVDDSEIKEGNVVYNSKFGIGTIINLHEELCYYSKDYKSRGSITTPYKRNLGDDCRTITHSTKPLEYHQVDVKLIDERVEGWVFNKIKQLSLSEVEELLFGYSVEKLANLHCEEQNRLSNDCNYDSFIKGFNTHKELTKDKLFTLEDMINFAVNCFNDNYDEDISFYKRVKINIEYLKPKTQWEVEFINGKLTLKQ